MSKRVTLGKAEACRQCRKRNYDQSPTTPPENNEDLSEQNLLKLEARIEELEQRLRLGNQYPKGKLTGFGIFTPLIEAEGPSPSTLHSPSYYRGVAAQSLDYSSMPSGYDPSTRTYNLTDFTLMAEDWPLELPPKPLMLHLIDIFFVCYPNSRRIIHRPTFLLQLLEHHSSPRFPFIPLLHSICAVAAVHSPHVTVAPLPDLSKYPVDDPFQDKTRVDQGRDLMFDEQHFILSKYQCMDAAREGVNLLGVIQACIINSWWAFSCARWFDLWAMNSLAMRMCIALGLNFSDSLYKPLPAKAREKFLIGPPTSHVDVELRRNIFWLTYCLERYHLFAGPWVFDINDDDIQQTLPGTLDAFEAGVCFDDGQERQSIFSDDLFSTHYNNQDDFAMYIKCAIMLSRVHVIELRKLLNYGTSDEVRDSREMKILETIISSTRASIKLHAEIANWQDPSCESSSKALAAARGILRYTTALTSSPFDFSRIDRVVCLPWSSAGRALVLSLKFAPESLAPILRAEIRLARANLELAGNRVILFLRQRCSFDKEAVDNLGEREAAKVYSYPMSETEAGDLHPKVFTIAAVVASFALPSHAKPMHHARGSMTITSDTSSVDAVVFIDHLKIFQNEVVACSEKISKAASTGEDPEDEMEDLNGIFNKMQISLTKLTPDQEKECAVIVAAVLNTSIKACHDVAANHKFMKFYAKWTETDFAMHSFMQKLAGVSFLAYKQSLIGAGKTCAVYLHDMSMRHMVNNFRGMGLSYE
ncbi:Fungal specific transcription factor domain [Rhizoctonia solani]|uniref:Fungal specific transcription factor domain n=1 Tax=Rhizoctonia solani TaxID=456999 RepID=A0A8H7LP91_9AGAM|nr:Fungal specific transcription factor domain [Rhizoctonia solani]